MRLPTVDIFARVRAQQGREAALAAVLMRHLPDVRLTRGCLIAHDYCSIRDPRLLYVHSRWGDLDAFESYARLSSTDQFAAAVADHMESPPLRAIRTMALDLDAPTPLPSGELYVFAPFHARTGEEPAVEEVLRSIHDATRQEDGCRAHRICRSVRDAALFYVHSIWLSEAAFEQHVGRAHTVRFVAQIEKLIDQPLEVTRARQIG